MKTKISFHGVFTAVVTPFKNASIDMNALHGLLDKQVEAGVHGVVLAGTTGESATLTNSEKLKMFEEVCRKYSGKLVVVAGAGSNSTESTVSFCKEASKTGVDGLLVVTPYYNKPTQEGLFAHYSEIAENVETPVIIYNVPGRTGVNILPETVARLGTYEKLQAVKEAGTFEQMNDMIMQNGKRFSILSGDDFTFMPFMALGGVGVISVVSNIAPKLMVDLYEASRKSDFVRARELHFSIYPLIKACFLETSPAPTKAALELMGLMKAGLRKPLVAVGEKTYANMKAKLSALHLI